mmetsp:Transcript_29459/g.35043  ORF Transcript_29459/g.35043 Transcript_29459/m.35043 type:complete len:329 (-) Transcript_29459:497-1483(-)
MENRKYATVVPILIFLMCIALFHMIPDREEREIAYLCRQHTLPLVEAELDINDIIYHTRNDARNYIPAVNEEYKTVFFFIGKCAASEWKRMFIRMMGSPNWCATWIHKKEVNGLKWLDDYSLKEAQHIMTSPEWTRAIFVRNPKDRALSAFLDKAVAHSDKFVKGICKTYGKRGLSSQACIDHHLEFDFFLRNITTAIPDNVHWMSIYDQIDAKWWPYINYVGNMENLAEDAETFLRSIVSDIDDVSAWDHWGKTGWSDDERNCEAKGTSAFLKTHDSKHETDAHKKLIEYFTPELEIFVEDRYATDLNNTYFQFSPIELFRHNEDAN